MRGLLKEELGTSNHQARELDLVNSSSICTLYDALLALDVEYSTDTNSPMSYVLLRVVCKITEGLRCNTALKSPSMRAANCR